MTTIVPSWQRPEHPEHPDLDHAVELLARLADTAAERGYYLTTLELPGMRVTLVRQPQDSPSENAPPRDARDALRALGIHETRP